MGRKNNKKNNKRKAQKKAAKGNDSNFLREAGPGCYIASRDKSPDWLIEWEDVDPGEFEGEEVPDVAVDTEEQTLSLCNIDNDTKIAYITVFDTRILNAKGEELPQGSTTDNDGNTTSCVTFIVLCPPRVFCHLCFLDVSPDHDISLTRIESDVREWNQHPNPSDEHPQLIGFPLQGGPFVCTQGENGELTHFFSGNLHAIDFRCPIGTPLLAVADGVVVESTDCNSLTGISVSNLFKWNSIIIRLDEIPEGENGKNNKNNIAGPLFVEYVHIQKSNVQKGDIVKRGQIIGTSGSIGFSPEPHLHFSAFRSSDPEAPTVRVRFESSQENQPPFLPRAGIRYDSSGPVNAI